MAAVPPDQPTPPPPPEEPDNVSPPRAAPPAAAAGAGQKPPPARSNPFIVNDLFPEAAPPPEPPRKQPFVVNDPAAASAAEQPLPPRADAPETKKIEPEEPKPRVTGSAVPQKPALRQQWILDDLHEPERPAPVRREVTPPAPRPALPAPLPEQGRAATPDHAADTGNVEDELPQETLPGPELLSAESPISLSRWRKEWEQRLAARAQEEEDERPGPLPESPPAALPPLPDGTSHSWMLPELRQQEQALGSGANREPTNSLPTKRSLPSGILPEADEAEDESEPTAEEVARPEAKGVPEPELTPPSELPQSRITPELEEEDEEEEDFTSFTAEESPSPESTAAPDRLGLPSDLRPLLAPPPAALRELLPTPAAAASPVEADEESLSRHDRPTEPEPRPEMPNELAEPDRPPVPPEPEQPIVPVNVLKGTEELDLWWGAYSGWALVPSFTLCVLATAAIGWVSWYHVPAEFFQITILGLTGAVWIVQITRWVYRVFGYNYRLTNRRLYVDRGWLYSDAHRVDLTQVKKVKVKTGWWEKIIKVGDIAVTRTGAPQADLILEAVAVPLRIARQIEHAIGLAREAEKP